LAAAAAAGRWTGAYDISDRAVRDLPWSSFRTVFIEIYRVNCPGLRDQSRDGIAVAQQGFVFEEI